MAVSSPTRLSATPAEDGRSGLRVAPARRQRRPLLILVGALLVLGGAAVAGQLFLQVGERSPVLAMARPVPAGQRIASQDLAVVRISVDPGLRVVPASERSQVVGQVATVDLLAQSLLTRQAVASTTVPGAGQAVVGIALKAGQMPNDLKAGDRVMLVLTPPAATAGGAASTSSEQQTGRVLVDDAEVFDLRQAETEAATVASVVVAQGQAPAVARAQATGQLSLVLVATTP